MTVVEFIKPALFILLDRYFLLRKRDIDLSYPKGLMNPPNDRVGPKRW